MAKYNFQKIEKKWQDYWQKNKSFSAPKRPTAQKKYILDMFPYPSGEGLHVGHVESYSAADIYSRYSLMKGYSVLHPQGFDAFGLPAENYAIKNNVHPAETTQKAMDNFKKQINSLGFSYDWSREVVTSRPDYYKWTQWLFLQLYKNNLAYRRSARVNWCDNCQTVLANEQAEGGHCERCEGRVKQKETEQWFFKTTAFIDDQEHDGRQISGLESGLYKIDWPDSTKAAQRNWIGRSGGAIVCFEIKVGQASTEKDQEQEQEQDDDDSGDEASADETVEVFTTRPDTLFGATYFVLAPEHPLIDRFRDNIVNYAAVKEYRKQAGQKTELERSGTQKEKTGILLEGIYAVNPVNNKKIPVFAADYVLIGYGTGAVMAVPGHDYRDFEFAQNFDLPVIPVVCSDIMSYRQAMSLLDILKQIKPEADKKGVSFWLLGAMAIAFRTGSFYRDISDIDIMVKDEAALEEFTALLIKMGFKRNDDRPYNPRLIFREFSDRNNVRISLTQFNYEYGLKPEDLEETPVDFCGIELRVVSRKYLSEYKKWQMENDSEKKDKHALDLKYLEGQVFSAEGIAVNSDFLDNLSTPEAKKAMVAWLEENSKGREAVNYRMRDWLVSRQRYWGAPIPIVYCDRCGIVPVPEKELPVVLPNDVDFRPTGESPLKYSESFYRVNCPSCGQKARREVDTMDTFVCSSWYYLRYVDPDNFQEFAAKELLDAWLPVDVYVGGAEHTVLHLLYARFFTKFLYKYGYVNFDEPFLKLRHQGTILAEDGRKMSKSKGNVVNPDDIVKEYGADALRIYEMFMGPLEDAKPWNTKGISGVSRFLERVWDMGERQKEADQEMSTEREAIQKAAALVNVLHKTIKKVEEDIESFKFNTAISQMMIFVKAAEKAELSLSDFRKFLRILAPFAPHIAEEIWRSLGKEVSIFLSEWPQYDPLLAKDEIIRLAVQINGKLRDVIEVSADIDEAAAVEIALASPKTKLWLKDREITKEVFVPGKLLNFVVK